MFLGFFEYLSSSFWSHLGAHWIFLKISVLPFILEEISIEVDVIDSFQYDFHLKDDLCSLICEENDSDACIRISLKVVNLGLFA